MGKRKQTRVHDISVSIKCLIGVYISSFDPTRSRYGSSARFLVQALRPSTKHTSERQPECRADNRLTRETRGERKRIGEGEFTRFSFGRLIHRKKSGTCFHKNGRPLLTSEKSIFIFRVHFNDQSAKIKCEKQSHSLWVTQWNFVFIEVTLVDVSSRKTARSETFIFEL